MKEKERLLDKNNMILRLEKLTQESICKSQISRGKLSKKRSLQEKGITLIALVVTIIILLILAGVTLNMALTDNGLFKKTKKAVEDYEKAQDKELAELYEISDSYDEMNGKVVLNGKWSEKNKVNMPKLSHTGLTPVELNEEANIAMQTTASEEIMKTVDDSKIQEEIWYSYKEDEKRWANAKTADGSMWVWIPRFAYKISYNDEGDKSKGGTIDIVFLKGTTDNPADDSNISNDQIVRANSGDTNGKYIVHPAFTDESENGYANGGWDEEIPGFWIAKFEAGYEGEANNPNSAKDSPVKYSSIYTWGVNNEDKGIDEDNYYYGKRQANETPIKWPTFQANRPSMNYIGVSDAYELCKVIGKKDASNNPYKLENIDSHMMKSSEWGAVAYLSCSKYGQNCEITANRSSVGGVNTIYTVTGYGNETNGKVKELTDLMNGSVAGSWATQEGQKASTTGNIYGVYDMRGGSYDMVAGYITPESENYTRFCGKLGSESNGNSSKYKSKFEGVNNSGNENYNNEINKKRVGEAIWETSSRGDEIEINDGGTYSSWNGDNSIFLKDELPFLGRGGCYLNAGVSGVFSFTRGRGMGHSDISFRPILISN